AASQAPDHVYVGALDVEVVDAFPARNRKVLIHPLRVDQAADRHGRWCGRRLGLENRNQRRAGGDCRSDVQELSYVHAILLTKGDVTRYRRLVVLSHQVDLWTSRSCNENLLRREIQKDGSAASQLTLGFHSAAMRLHEMFDDREAQPGAALLPRPSRIDAVEPLEDARQMFGR